MLLTRTLLPCALIAFASQARAQITFAISSIDSNNSGDCKAVADIDGDGKKDPIIAGGGLAWYEAGANFAKRTLRTSPVYDEFTTGMQTGDIDNDGDIDLIIPDSGPGNTGTVFWFENPRINPPAGHGSDPRVAANWTYHAIGTQGAVVHDIEVADLDNDGRLDVVGSGHGAGHIWKQNSPTSWTVKDISSMSGSGISIGDIDRDGFRDIGTPAGWIRNPHTIAGSWTFFPISQSNNGDACLIADFNGDSRPDLLVCPAHSRGTMAWFENPATATSPTWTRRTIDSSMGAHHPEAADFNADGRADILMGLERQDLSVYINGGGPAPAFAKIQLDSTAGHNARAGDMDNDGFPDVLGCDYIGNPPARIYINQSAPTAPCYPNCDQSEIGTILTANDFQCFLNRFAAAETYANCDGSTVSPVLNANDFQCFLNAFALGCP